MVPIRYWQVDLAGRTGFPSIRSIWQIPEGHMCLSSPDMAKMDPSAADMALALWNGCVQDATI